MMTCKDCYNGCAEPLSDKCITWTSDSIPELGIEQNKCYAFNIVNLAMKLVTLLKENYADLKSLTSNQDSIVKLPVAVQFLIDYIIELRSSEVMADSNLYCLGGNVSTCGASIQNKTFNYSLSPSDNGITFTYNASPTLNNLPQEITSGTFKVVAEGLLENGSIIIVDTPEKVGGFTIPLNRLPAVVSIQCNLGSACGDMVLYKRLAIAQPVNKSYTAEFSLQDFSFNDTTGLTQKNVNELMAAELCKQREDLENIKIIEIQDCPEGTKYPDKQINSIIQVQGAVLCDLQTQMKHIGERLVKARDCQSNCAEKIYEITLQEWINKTDDTLCQTVDLLGTLEQDIIEIKARLNNCCPASSSGASSGSSSGCPNGNCS